MMGPPENPGVNRRAIRELFNICEERDDVDYQLEVCG
jgi:kinesin family protein C2/C3